MAVTPSWYTILILGILGKISTSFVLCLVVRYAPHQLWWKNELMPGRPFITFNPMKEKAAASWENPLRYEC